MVFAWRLVCASLLTISLTCSMALAQGRALRAPSSERVPLETHDGVQLSLTYYGSSAGKQTTPVVILHDYKESQAQLESFARRLQSPGEEDTHPPFAVVTVDLRGHGNSTKQLARNGRERELDAAKLGKNGLVDMVRFDMEKIRSFLVGKNDEGMLNLNKLCILGVGMGATVGVNWSAQDWATPPLAVGKQGQDVKALVLISPRWKYRGIGLQDALRLKPLKKEVAWMMAYGAKDSKVKADVKRIYKQLEKYHPEPASSRSEKPRDLLVVGLNTNLQGSKLLRQAGLPLEDRILKFLTVHVHEQDFSWSKRRRSFD